MVIENFGKKLIQRTSKKPCRHQKIDFILFDAQIVFLILLIFNSYFSISFKFLSGYLYATIFWRIKETATNILYNTLCNYKSIATWDHCKGKLSNCLVCLFFLHICILLYSIDECRPIMRCFALMLICCILNHFYIN